MRCDLQCRIYVDLRLSSEFRDVIESDVTLELSDDLEGVILTGTRWAGET